MSDNSTSEPPPTRATRLRVDAVVDISAMVILASLLITGSIPENLRDSAFWVIVAIGGGNQILALLRRRSGVIMTLLGILPSILKSKII